MSHEHDWNLIYKPDRIKAVCTWGFGSDIMLVDEEITHPIDGGLTIAQARHLAQSLIHAANNAEELEQSYLDWCEKHSDWCENNELNARKT